MRKRKISSFASERTVEFALAPRLAKGLAQFHDDAIPFYYWANREGNSVSRGCTVDGEIRVIAVFARRPKVESCRQQQIELKINSELFAYSEVAIKFGIVTFAGIPCSSSIWDFSNKAKLDCLWFHLTPECSFQDRSVTVDLRDGVNRLSEEILGVSGPMGYQEISDIARTNEAPKEWPEWLDAIREVRSSHASDGTHYRHRFGLIGGYKPFYVALIN